MAFSGAIFRLNLRLQYSLDFTKMKVYLLKKSLKFQKAVTGFNIYNLHLLPSCLKVLERRMTMPIYKKSSKYFDSQNQLVNLTITVLTIRVRKKKEPKRFSISHSLLSNHGAETQRKCGKPSLKTGRGPEIKEKRTTIILHATAKQR